MSSFDSQRAVYRILDASINRATEGFRTIEEFARFGLDDAKLAGELKSCRHELASAVKLLSQQELLSSRDTVGDVGTQIETAAEYQRSDVSEVVRAATERVQQSLRVLEEYGKTIEAEFAKRVEQLRYRTYTLHRDVQLIANIAPRRNRLADAQLYLLIDCHVDREEAFVDTIRSLGHAGVDVFQLRDKTASDRLLYERAKVGSIVAKELNVLFIVNDRADIAVAADADGVHIGQEELPIDAARRCVGRDRLIGVSTHNIDQVHDAISAGADYLGCGPTFPSQTKTFSNFPGTDFLKLVHAETRSTPRPAFAIGGICSQNLDQVIGCGFHRVAVTAAISQASDPVQEAKTFKSRLEKSRRWF